jgi:hypothetical protein
MSVPAVVEDAIDPDESLTRIDLGGDELFVQRPKTVVYRAEGLLSDESVEEIPHDAERVTVDEGKKNATVELDCGLDGVHSLSVPSSRVDDALGAILTGVLATTGVTDPGERAIETFRFSELTVIVTSRRVLTHVGAAVWDEEAVAFEYDRVTDLAFEEGSVATEVVLTHDGRRERFKAPNETARVLRERLEGALCAAHGVDSIADLDLEADEEVEGEDSERADPFDSPIEPLSVDPPRLDGVDETGRDRQSKPRPADGGGLGPPRRGRNASTVLTGPHRSARSRTGVSDGRTWGTSRAPGSNRRPSRTRSWQHVSRRSARPQSVRPRRSSARKRSSNG